MCPLSRLHEIRQCPLTSPFKPSSLGPQDAPCGSHNDIGGALFDPLLVEREKFIKTLPPSKRAHCVPTFHPCGVRSDEDWVAQLGSKAGIVPTLFVDNFGRFPSIASLETGLFMPAITIPLLCTLIQQHDQTEQNTLSAWTVSPLVGHHTTPVQLGPQGIFWGWDRHLCRGVLCAWGTHYIGATESTSVGQLTTSFIELDSRVPEKTFVVCCRSRKMTVAVLLWGSWVRLLG